MIGGQSLIEGFAECGNGVGKGFETVVDDHAREMERVALCVEVPFECGGVVATKIE